MSSGSTGRSSSPPARPTGFRITRCRWWKANRSARDSRAAACCRSPRRLDSCAMCHARWRMRTNAASSTGTSSLTTSCSPAARRRSRISASPRPSAHRARREARRCSRRWGRASARQRICRPSRRRAIRTPIIAPTSTRSAAWRTSCWRAGLRSWRRHRASCWRRIWASSRSRSLSLGRIRRMPSPTS